MAGCSDGSGQPWWFQRLRRAGRPVLVAVDGCSRAVASNDADSGGGW